MKNKITRTLTALCAALMLMGGFSVTAFAQTPTTEETDDSGVIVETEPQPLTPEGNMTLVDDIDGDAAEELADGRIITAPMPVMAHPHSNASESVLVMQLSIMPTKWKG